MSSKKNITLYTDGGSHGNPGPGGYGVVILDNGTQKELMGGYRLTTNNRMEIMGAIVGLESLKQPSNVTLFSDSKYLVDAMMKGWVTRWRANGWKRDKKEKAKNIDLWKRLLKAGEKHTVAYQWLKGHAGHPGNEHADKLTNLAVKGKLLVDKGYESEAGKKTQQSKMF